MDVHLVTHHTTRALVEARLFEDAAAR